MAGQVIAQITPVEIQATPGGTSASVRVELFNSGQIVDQFWAGPLQAPEWLVAPPAMVSLFPEQRGSIALSLGIAADRLVPAGVYRLTIRVVSASTRQVVHDQQITLRVTAVAGSTALRLEPEEAYGGKYADMEVEVSHGGNTTAEVVLSAEDPARLLAFAFNPPQLSVPPSGSARASCRVWGRRPYLGDTVQHRFTVRATGLQQPLEAAGMFNQLPVFAPRRVRIMAISMVALGALVVVLAGLLLTWTRFDGVQFGGLDWDYRRLALAFFPTAVVTGAPLMSPWLSGGSLVIVFAAVALVGALVGKASVARAGSALIIALSLALVIGLLFAEQKHQFSSGVFVILAGGVVALLGALLVKPLGKTYRTPRAPRVPRIPGVPPPPRLPYIR